MSKIAVCTGDFDRCAAVDFSCQILCDTLINTIIHVYGVLYVESPMIESFTDRLDPM